MPKIVKSTLLQLMVKIHFDLTNNISGTIVKLEIKIKAGNGSLKLADTI